MKSLLASLITMASLVLPGLAGSGEAGYLVFDPNGDLVASGPFQFTVAKPAGHEAVGPATEQERFLGENLTTSIAGYLAADRFFLVQIETTDAPAGTISYDALPTLTMAGIEFSVREGCLDFPDPGANQNPVVQFLVAKGYPLAPAQYVRQVLKVTGEGTAEGMVLFARHVESCTGEDVGEAFMKEFDEEFQAFVKGSRRNN